MVSGKGGITSRISTHRSTMASTNGMVAFVRSALCFESKTAGLVPSWLTHGSMYLNFTSTSSMARASWASGLAVIHARPADSAYL